MKLALIATALLFFTAVRSPAEVERIYSREGSPVGLRVIVTSEDLEKNLSDAKTSVDRCRILLDLENMYANERKLDRLADTVIRREESCPGEDSSDLWVVRGMSKENRSEFVDILGRIVYIRDRLAGTKLGLAKLCVELERKDDAAKYLTLAMKAAWDDQTIFGRVWRYVAYNVSVPDRLRNQIAARMHELDPKDKDAAMRVLWYCQDSKDAQGAIRAARDIAKEISDGEALLAAANVLAKAEEWLEAADAFKQSGKLNEMNWPDCHTYARACSKAGRAYEAVKVYHQLLSISNTDGDRSYAYWSMCEIYQDRKDYSHMAQMLIESQDPSPDGHWGWQVMRSFAPDSAKPLADALAEQLKGSDKHPVSLLQLSQIYWDTQRYELSRDLVKKVAADYPRDHYILGLVMDSCMRDRELRLVGVAVGRNVVKLPPVSKTNWLRYAMLCDYAKLGDEAVEAARALVQGWPNDWSSTINTVSIFRNYGRWDDAIDAAKKAIAANPDSRDFSEFTLAQTYSACGRYSEAGSICRKLVAEGKNENMKSQCKVLLALMAAKDAESSTNDGVRSLVDAIKAGNERPIVSVLSSIIFNQSSKEGLEALVRGLEAVPPADRISPLYNVLVGPLYDYMGRQVEARRLCTAAVISKVNNADLLYYIYEICVRTKDGALAVDVCKRLVKVKPDDYRSFESLAGAYHLAGQKDLARSTARSYAKKFRDDPVAIWSAGDVLAGWNNVDEAEAMMDRAIKKADELAASGRPVSRNIRENAWGSLQVMYYRTGQKVKEIECVRKLLAVPPNPENLPFLERRLSELRAAGA